MPEIETTNPFARFGYHNLEPEDVIRCPECGIHFDVRYWRLHEDIPCRTCGEHDAVSCPNDECVEFYDDYERPTVEDLMKENGIKRG